MPLTREDAIAILEMPCEEAIERILLLGEKAEKYDREHPDSPTTPSGMKKEHTLSQCPDCGVSCFKAC